MFVPKPAKVPSGNQIVDIGTPVYVVDGYNVTIDCDVISGVPPITISWFHNGDLFRGNVSTITITDANDGDVFTCRAENNIGYDKHETTLNVFGK